MQENFCLKNTVHIHHAKSGGGQILVCVAGRGYYQEEGKEAIEMKPGDCINILFLQQIPKSVRLHFLHDGYASYFCIQVQMSHIPVHLLP